MTNQDAPEFAAEPEGPQLATVDHVPNMTLRASPSLRNHGRRENGLQYGPSGRWFVLLPDFWMPLPEPPNSSPTT